MNKNLLFLFMLIASAWMATPLKAQTYDMEYVAQDLLISTNGEASTTFQGTADETNLDFTIFAVGYGEHQIEGYIGRYRAEGTAVYSYSEELHSDLLVAIMDVADKGWTVKVTMYSLYIAPKDTIVCYNMTKTITNQGWVSVLTLKGSDEKYGNLSFTIRNCSGGYGDYPAVAGKVGSLNVSGKGTWSNAGKNDLLEAILSTDDEKDVFFIQAYTPAENVTSEEVDIVVNDAIFVFGEEELTINGNSTDGQVVALELYEFGTYGYGTYPTSLLSGTIDDIQVANLQEEATLSLEGDLITLEAVVVDGEQNIYTLTITGSDLAKDTIQVHASNMTKSVYYGDYLQLKASTDDNQQISLLLYDGVNRGYDEYGYTDGIADVENASFGNVSLQLSQDIAAKYYLLGDIEVFDGVFEGNDDRVYHLLISSAQLPSGIQDAQLETRMQKRIEDGQLVIICNDVKYNANGIIIQ